MAGVLGMFLVIALSSTFIEYVRMRRTRLSGLTDVTTVLVLRKTLMKVCAKAFSTHEVALLALPLFGPVATRKAAGRSPPR